ncbi:MAG: methyltransferase domain-containing protein [Sporichthyaceae bacterium]
MTSIEDRTTVDLRCPQTHLPLREVSADEADWVVGGLQARLGAPFGVTDRVLLRSDDAAAYAIVDGIPILLGPEVLTADVPQPDLRDPRWGEAYDEMEFYNRTAGDEEAIERLHARMSAMSGPLGRDWLDCNYDAAAQLDCLEHIGSVADRSVLQLGGKGLHAVKFLLAGAAQGLLVTPMLSEVEFGRRLAERFGVADRFVGVVAVAEQLPFASDSIDVMYSGGCLHHMTAHYAASEFNRVLAPGGVLAAVEPWRTALHGIGTRVIGKREANAFCRPLDTERMASLAGEFPDLELRHHGPVLRYAALAAMKLTKHQITPATGLRIAKVDDRIPLPRRYGGSVAVLATGQSSV